MSLVLATFYVAVADAAFIIELVCQILHLIPAERNAQVLDAGISFNYTTVLNLIFLFWQLFLLVAFSKRVDRRCWIMMNHPDHATNHYVGRRPDVYMVQSLV